MTGCRECLTAEETFEDGIIDAKMEGFASSGGDLHTALQTFRCPEASAGKVATDAEFKQRIYLLDENYRRRAP